MLVVEGHSIYVRNLPYDATVEQLEEEFKKFGPIKREGVQVRSSKVCYGSHAITSLIGFFYACSTSTLVIDVASFLLLATRILFWLRGI